MVARVVAGALKAAANEIALKSHSHKEVDRPENQKAVLNMVEIENRALRFKEKSELFYKVALNRYSNYLSKQRDSFSNILPGLLKNADQADKAELMKQFVKDFIPFSEQNVGIDGFSDDKLFPGEINHDSPGDFEKSDFSIDAESPDIEKDQAPPGIDKSADESGGGKGFGI